MKMVRITLLIAFLFCINAIGKSTAHNSNPSSNDNSHRVYIGFTHNQNMNQCRQVINKFSGQIVEKLRDFAFPVYLVSIDNPLSSVDFEKQVVSEMKKVRGVRFASLERKQMKNAPLMAVNSVSMQRQGNIAISAPKKSAYDYTKNSTRKNKYYKVLERHLPGLKSKVRSRSLVNKNKSYRATFECDIDKNGEVSHVRMLENNIHDVKVRKQLKQKIYSWKDFPRRTSNDILTVRFKFNSN